METAIRLPKTAPTYAPAATEELLAGRSLLRQAFLETPALSAERDAVIIKADIAEPPALLLHRGIAYRSLALLDGRRSIVDLLLPTDIIGLDHAVMGKSSHEIVAANTLGYRLLKPARVRELLRDPRVALRALALAAEERRRAHRHVTEITRLDARGRLAAMLVAVYDRLRREELVSRPTFNLSLTQDQIADHLGITMVHVSRTLRRMREEKIVIVDRQVVIILDLDRLRHAATGIPPLDAPEPIETRTLPSAAIGQELE
ncbi:MAG TPA: Crp/Fnr family transcriptional regulator [Stellaceae bacterium]|jgi:CRP-like cAMP-binding protein